MNSRLYAWYSGLKTLHWGSEYQPFEYWKHLNFNLFGVWISNGSIFKWPVYVYVLCTRLTIWIPDQYIRKQDGVHLSGIQMVGLSSVQMAFEYQTIWYPTSFYLWNTGLIIDHWNIILVWYSDPHCIPMIHSANKVHKFHFNIPFKFQDLDSFDKIKPSFNHGGRSKAQVWLQVLLWRWKVLGLKPNMVTIVGIGLPTRIVKMTEKNDRIGLCCKMSKF